MTQTVQGGQVTTDAAVLHVAFELSNKEWKLGFSDGKRTRYRSMPARNLGIFERELKEAKKRFRLGEDVRVVSCYEAGRDGFWIDRYLKSSGIESLVIEPASVQVDRRARRPKTDKLDARKLLNHVVRSTGGERDVWRVVRVPSDQAEDRRQGPRERQRLVKEATIHRNRIQSVLVAQGIVLKPCHKGFMKDLEEARRWDGTPVPCDCKRAVMREYRRLELVQEQIAEIETTEKQRVKEAKTETDEKIGRLKKVRGIGLTSAMILVTEFFGWRKFNNRREVGALAGMTGTPFNSGDSNREQGISKAGNRRIRVVMVELAWRWLRWQPDSKQAQWFKAYTGDAKKRRIRRIAIVALARRLLIDLWHYLDHGVIPEGAYVAE
ncbi:IS110 family transposase [Planctomycetota bacterium]